MKYRINVLQKAKNDLTEAFDWYENKQAGLGNAFLASIDFTLGKIAVNPRMFPVIEGEIRKALVPKFPYSIYFEIEKHTVVVYAFVHSKRHPDSWKAD